MLAERLRKLRKEKRLTQEDVANRIGVARTTYAMYEQERREPDSLTLQKIADFFEVSTDYLLGRTDLPNNNQSNTDHLKAWLRQSNTDLSEEEIEELEEDIKDYLEVRMKRISRNKK